MEQTAGDRSAPFGPSAAPGASVPHVTPRLIVLLTGVLLAGIFAWDLVTPLGQMPWLLYAPVLLLTLMLPYRWDALALAAICTALIVVDFFFSPSNKEHAAAIFNRSVGVVMIWSTAVGCLLYKQALQALRISEGRLREILDNSPNLIFLKDLQGRYLLINREFERAMSMLREEILGRTDAEMFPAAQAAMFQMNDRKVLEAGHALEFEEEAMQKDGLHTSIVQKFPLCDQRGTVYAVGGIVTDITSRKQVEEALQASRSDLAEAQRVAKIGSWSFDLVGNHVTWSDELYRIFGLSKADFAGTYESFASRVHHADRLVVLQTIEKARTEGQSFDIEYRILLPNEDIKTIHAVGYASRDAEGKVVRLFGTAQDITERKRVAAALQAKETLLSTVVQVEPECVKLVGLDGSLIMMNKAGLRMIEADSLEQVAGHCIYPLVAEQHRRQFQDLVERVFDEESGTLEFEIVGLKGTRRWLETHTAPLRDETGRITAAVGVTRDITVRKRAEEALKESEARYRIVMRATNDVIRDWDLRTNAVWWSENFFELFGYRRDEIEPGAESWSTRLHPDDRNDVMTEMFSAIQNKQQLWAGEYRLRRADGSYACVYDRGFIHFDESGTPVRMTGAFIDITARKRAEELLRSSRDELRALSSHLQSVRERERMRIARELHDEFGQVLTGLKLDLSWLGGRLADLGKGRAVKPLVSRASEMMNLVDESIAMIRKLVAELRPAILDHLDLVAALEWLARDFQRRTRIPCGFRCGLAKIDLDRDRTTAVFRIVQEALTNVSRHAEATRVTVWMEDSGGLLQLGVEDNGKGINDHEISSPSSFGILGMKERIELLRGQISFQGRPAGGTTVTVRFPMETGL